MKMPNIIEIASEPNLDPTAKLTQRIDFVRKNEVSAGSFSRET
jgi:hypothetical protein